MRQIKVKVILYKIVLIQCVPKSVGRDEKDDFSAFYINELLIYIFESIYSHPFWKSEYTYVQ